MSRDERDKVESTSCRFSHLALGRTAPKVIKFLTPRRILTAYLLSVITPFIALGAQYCLTMYAHMTGALIALFIFPVLIASTLGGLGPGLLATGIGIGLTLYFVLPPMGYFAIAQTADWVRLGTLLILSLMITLLNTILHRTIGRSIEVSEELERDVVCRKQAEEALSRSEQRFRIAEKLATMGHYDWNVAEDSILASPSLESIHGLAPGEFTGGFEKWLAMVHPEDRMNVRRGIEEGFRRQLRETSLEFRIVRPDDEVRWISSRAITEYEPVSKSALHVLGAMTDITERRRAEEKVRESENLFRSFFENSMDGILLTNPGIRIERANPAACQILGRSEEELLTLSRDAIFDTSNPGATPIVEERERTGKYNGEMTYLRSDGSRFPVEMSSAIYKDSAGRDRAFTVFRDITERKRVEEALRESEARLALAMRGAAAGAWETDLDNGNNIWDKGMPELLGIPSEQAEVESKRWIEYVHPEDRDRIVASFNAASQEGKPWAADFRILRTDGSVRWCNSRGAPVVSPSGRRKMIGIEQDITERKQDEEALKQALNWLEFLTEQIPAILWTTGLNPLDWTECVRVADRILSPERGQKGSCHEVPEKIPSRVQTPSH